MRHGAARRQTASMPTSIATGGLLLDVGAPRSHEFLRCLSEALPEHP
jgi:hypothetical protein